MKKFIITLFLGLLISSSVLARSTGCKRVIVITVMVNGFIQIKLLMKVSG